MAAKTIHFDVFASAADKQWRWHLRARNGRIIATSGEGYQRVGKALSEIAKLVRDMRHLDSALAPITSHFVAGKETLIRCVVIGCRVDEGEAGFHTTGTLLTFMQDTPIAYVEQVEQAAFRARSGKAHTRST